MYLNLSVNSLMKMCSLRQTNRVKRALHECQQLAYLNALPDLDPSEENQECVPENFSDDNFDRMSSSSGRTNSSDGSTDSPEIDLISPKQSDYCEVFFEGLISHIGLKLSEAEKVIFLFNDYLMRYTSSQVYLPSLRYYWDKQSKQTSVHTYILCKRKHSHGPFIGEPNQYGTFECEKEIIPVVIKPGDFFLHIPFRPQIIPLITTLPDSCWIYDSNRLDVSNCKQARACKEEESDPKHVKFTLTLHADEVAAGKSSTEKIFPVFLTINEMKPEFRRKFFLMIALYVGRTKPDVNCFLGPVCDELLDLATNPIEIDPETKVSFHLIGLISDAPMRAYLRNVRQYNHTHGCDWCLVEATQGTRARQFTSQSRNDMVGLKRKQSDFLELKDLILNNSENFRSEFDLNQRFRGLKGISPLLNLPSFNIVDGVAVEPMHAISLGVFRNILSRGLLQGDLIRLRETGIDRNVLRKEMSSRLVSISVPSEFTRQPRDFDQLKHWKSSEFDSFLAYFIYVTLKGLLKAHVINHLCCLSRIYYLSHVGPGDGDSRAEISNLVEEFQVGCDSIYGKNFLTYNLHILSHLADSIENLGPNSNMSSYPLEDYMGIIKEKVHRYSNIGPSLIRFFMSDFRYKNYKAERLEKWNLSEKEKWNFGCLTSRNKLTFISDKYLNSNSKITAVESLKKNLRITSISEADLNFYYSVKKDGKRYSSRRYCEKVSRDDSKIKGKDGQFYSIEYIIRYNSKIYFLCYWYQVKQVNIAYKGFTGSFRFSLPNTFEIDKILEKELVCLRAESVMGKVIYIASKNFSHRYVKDHIVEQYLWNK